MAYLKKKALTYLARPKHVKLITNFLKKINLIFINKIKIMLEKIKLSFAHVLLITLALGLGVGTIIAVDAEEELVLDGCLEEDKEGYYPDQDQDGYGDHFASSTLACPLDYDYFVTNNQDFDDEDPNVNPTKKEVCGDNIDNDSDGETDESGIIYYYDEDGDGYGRDNATTSACVLPEGYALEGGDLNDSDPDINPGEEEVCGDGIDNDSDGEIDESGVIYYRDADGDTYGDPASTTSACAEPDGYVGRAGDWDDDDTTIYPNAPELCDGKDNDQDGIVDENKPVFYFDADGDGYGSSTVSTSTCEAPVNFVALSGDCNDNNSSIYPGGAEICDGLDNDCDGLVDEVGSTNTYFYDNDGDGYGNSASATSACAVIDNEDYVAIGGDWNDNNNTVYPGAPELCSDSLDNDQDGTVNEGCDNNNDDDGDNGDGDDNDCDNDCGQHYYEEKVTICHIPGGNPAAAHTISIGRPALKAHLAHGDYEGACRVEEAVEEEAGDGEADSLESVKNAFKGIINKFKKENKVKIEEKFKASEKKAKDNEVGKGNSQKGKKK